VRALASVEKSGSSSSSGGDSGSSSDSDGGGEGGSLSFSVLYFESLALDNNIAK